MTSRSGVGRPLFSWSGACTDDWPEAHTKSGARGRPTNNDRCPCRTPSKVFTASAFGGLATNSTNMAELVSYVLEGEFLTT
jgi:hypothetical protein